MGKTAAFTKHISNNLPLGFAHCQGCGEEHKRSDLINVCIFCIQAKFIPRQAWMTIGFKDRKSFEQWWNHEKKFKIRELKKVIAQIKERERLRQAWFDSGVYKEVLKEEEEDDKEAEAFFGKFKEENVIENGLAIL